jgi:tRNA (guanine26-N2/guanine27-N2)-dimethyltransferase
MADIVKEGRVRIAVENMPASPGPGRRTAGFYNPVLEADRDLSVAFADFARARGARTFLDGLSATGIRGMRIKRELDGPIAVHINERNPRSFALIKNNLARNNVEATVSNDHLCSILARQHYDYIDIDPYGTPAPFVFCLPRALGRRSFVTVTATDTATLCGVYPATCRRRYMAESIKGMGAKETGLRILVGFIVRQLASSDIAFGPQMAYVRRHFFRVYGIARRGARRADDALHRIGWLTNDDGWQTHPLDDVPKNPAAGPLYVGPLYDAGALDHVQRFVQKSEYASKETLLNLLALFQQERELPPFHYESGAVGRLLARSQPKMGSLLAALRKYGHTAGPCHYAPDAFKTDAPMHVIAETFK